MRTTYQTTLQNAVLDTGRVMDVRLYSDLCLGMPATPMQTVTDAFGIVQSDQVRLLVSNCLLKDWRSACCFGRGAWASATLCSAGAKFRSATRQFHQE